MKFLTALAMSFLTFFFFSLFLALPAHAAHWQPPIGIPSPSFGIEEVAPTYDQTNSLHYWVSGPSNCNDANNGGRGSPSAPRCTVPTTLSAGSLVEVRGGPYTILDITWTSSGTATQPVFVRGPNTFSRPAFQGGDITLQGPYFIVENIDLSAASGVNGRIMTGGNYVAVRGNYLHDAPGATGSAVANSGNDVVIYNNEIARFGTGPRDTHGVWTSCNTQRVWIVDNHIHGNSGDGVQFGHACWNNPPPSGASFVYIGRNLIHDDRENAVDIKQFVGPAVVSQNTMYGYQASTTSSGEAIRLNDEGTQGEVWVLYNRIYNSTACINGWHSLSNNYFIGNVLHDCAQGAIYIDNIISNTIYNTTRGILGNIPSQAATYGLTDATNNLIHTTVASAEGMPQHIGVDVTTCRNNLVWQNGAATTVQSSCTNTVTSNPLLANPATNDFHLQSGSAAIDSGFFNHPAYDYYFNTYGLNIKVDFDKNVRPQGSAWDIGAYEYFVAGPDTTPPLRSSGAPSGTLPAGTTSATLSLTTNEAATCRYSTTAGVAYTSMIGTFTTTGGTSHSRSFIGLTNGQTYSYYVRCQDTAGNANTNDYLITFSVATPDTTPPTAPSGLTATVSGTSVSLSWTAATDNVGVTNYNVHRSTTSGFTPSTINRIAQPTATSYTDLGLAVGTYYYRVTAQDAAGNVGAASSQASAAVAADVTPPIISSVLASSITSNSATITWTTNEASDTQVEYGLTPSYGSLTTLNTAMVTSHSQTVTGLAPNTLYYYRVRSRDAAGNLAVSGGLTLTTTAVTTPNATYEGYGSVTKGADDCPTGATTYRVTTLADSGPGSFRDAVSQSCRKIVFDVAGTITLTSRLAIKLPYFTIDGSTAPAPGITITTASETDGLKMTIAGTRDIILRHIRFTGHYTPGTQGSGLQNIAPLSLDGDASPDFVVQRIIFDHLTVANVSDGGSDIWGEARDITISNSLFYYNYQPMTISFNSPVQVRNRISLHHNVFAKNVERNPQVRQTVQNFDFVNNIIYDWSYQFAGSYGTRIRNDAGEGKVNANLINNAWLAGNNNPSAGLVYGTVPGQDSTDNGPPTVQPQGTVVTTTSLGQLYVNGNTLPPQNMDHYSTIGTPIPVPAYAQVTTYPASGLGARVLPSVGMMYRDATETALINEISSKIGGPPVDTTPPTAPSGLTATVLGTSVSLSWTAATDNVGVTNYNVHRSTTSGFTPSTINRIAQPTATSYTDSGLAVGTYYYRVTAQDAAGNVGSASSEASATVTAVDTTPPVRSNALPTGALPAGITSATLSLTTDEAATCRYSITPNIAYSSMTIIFSTTGGTSHSTAVSGLNNGNTYNYYVRCQDTAGNANTNDYLITFSIATTSDTIPPTVSITSPPNGATVSGAITVSATASDNVGVAGVQFLLDGSNLGAEDTAAPYSVLWNTAASINGAHTLTARARDSSGNTNTATVTLTSSNHFAITFSVSSGADTTPPLISNGQPIGILPPGTSQATISLTTNEQAICRYSTIPNTDYASMTNTFATTGGIMHSSLITGLTNGTTYTYYVRCIDTSNNANSNDFTIMFGVASQNKSVYNMTFVPRLEGTNYLTGTNFTFIMYYPGTTTQVAQFTTQPGATTGYIPLPPTVVMNASTYDILLDAPFYLSKRITNVSLVPNAIITLPPLIGGDLNDDNVINSLDWSLMSPKWFTNDTIADINRDTLVNTIDFSLMNKNWGLTGDI